MKTGFIYSDVFLKHEPPAWHPESKQRLLHIIDALKQTGLWQRLVHIPPRKATFDDVAMVHTPQYIQKIKSIGVGCLDAETYICSDTVESALYACGAIMEAIDRIKLKEIETAFCPVRPPGHHAEADEGMGFCIFNNVAVSARYAQKVGYSKVMIIDFDAHHGNGTQHIFEEDDTVFYFSTHQHPYYPETGKESERGKGKGLGCTYNVTIQAGSGNKDFIYVYIDLLPDVMRRFAPDIVLVSAGYDIHFKDPHADLRVTDEGMRGITQGILYATDVPIIFVLEGGYDLEALSRSVIITIEEMLKK